MNLYTNMHLIGPSDGAVLLYTLRLQIYGATSVKNFLVTTILTFTPLNLKNTWLRSVNQ